MPPPQQAGPPLPPADRYCKDDLQHLLQKAQTFLRMNCPVYRETTWFCREKFRAYFDDIDANHSGVMTKYTKDNHGDPRNPINGRIDGLFFNPCIDYLTGQPPTDSIYGDTRIKVRAGKLYKRAPNLYFSDFYCVSDKHFPHYVQLVMTSDGTDADCFCRANLVPISATDSVENPFFYVDAPDTDVADVSNTGAIADVEPKCFVACSPSTRKTFWVEMFFTDDVDLKLEQPRSQVRYFGHRFGGTEGLKKNTGCPTCSN